MLKDAKSKRVLYQAVLESKELGVWGSFGRIPEQDVAVLQSLQDYLFGRGPCLVYFTLEPSSERSRTGLVTSATGPKRSETI